MDTSPEAALPLTPAVFQICLVLAAGEAHGYAIMQAIGLGPGTLYRSVHRMLDDGWIEVAAAGADPDERRTTYRLTRAGRTIARAEAERLARLVHAARAAGLLGQGATRARRGAHAR